MTIPTRPVPGQAATPILTVFVVLIRQFTIPAPIALIPKAPGTTMADISATSAIQTREFREQDSAAIATEQNKISSERSEKNTCKHKSGSSLRTPVALYDYGTHPVLLQL